MADLSYTIDVNTTPAQRNIDNLNKKLAGVTTAFDKLKSALAGIALGAVIGRANQFADAMQDISDATGIATNVIMGFSSAVLENGGDAEKANTSILKFAQSIGDAAEGGKEAQLAFQNVGISLEDLRTLSEADLLQRAIQGIGKLDSATERMGAQVALFGKNARAINFQGVAGGMGSAVAGATQYATAIKAGADAQQALEVNLKNLTTALLSVIEPLNKIVGSVNISISAFESLIKVLAYAAGAYLIFTRGIAAVKTLMDALSVLLKTQGGLWGRISAQIMLMVGALLSIYKGLGRATGAVAGGTSALFSFAGAIAGVLRFLLRFTGVVGIIMAVAEAVNFLSKQFFNFDIVGAATDKLKQFYEYAKKVTGLGKVDVGAGGGRGGNDAITKQLQDRGEELRKQSEQARETQSYFKKQEEALKAGVAQFLRANEQAAKMIDFEATMVGKTEDQVEMQRGLNDLTAKYTDEIQKLKDAKKQLGTDETELRKIYDGQIASLEKNKQADLARLTSSITGLQTAKLLEQDRLNTLQLITDAMQRQKDIAGVTSGVYSDMSKKLNEIAFGKSQQGKSVFDQQKAQIERNIQLLEADMAGAITAAFETEDGFTNIQQMNLELEKMYALTNELRAAQLSELGISNQWATGWQTAFASYMENATNAAKIAGEQFNAVTNGMNSAIDKFVENGKFSFKDMANSIIKDLLKIELKKQAAFALSGATSFLGSLFGGFFANGGQPPVGKPSVVGENGPELFIPKTAGTIIPNGGTGGGSAPGAGGNTYITNNISAVDAKSVAQLFAENRRTLFGTVELARKEMSYGR
jgi:lambda family phage tail tape measure protein